ncbi:MAG TPA: hypothetical protein V6D09_07755 [Leptolyngbyaceae cyanobacterium]
MTKDTCERGGGRVSTAVSTCRQVANFGAAFLPYLRCGQGGTELPSVKFTDPGY